MGAKYRRRIEQNRHYIESNDETIPSPTNIPWIDNYPELALKRYSQDFYSAADDNISIDCHLMM